MHVFVILMEVFMWHINFPLFFLNKSLSGFSHNHFQQFHFQFFSYNNRSVELFSKSCEPIDKIGEGGNATPCIFSSIEKTIKSTSLKRILSLSLNSLHTWNAHIITVKWEEKHIKSNKSLNVCVCEFNFTFEFIT